MENGGPGHDRDGIEEGVDNVLCSSRAGLIFTRSQEGTQPDRLTRTGQTILGIRYHVLSCWVPSGELARGKLITAWEHSGYQAVRVALCISLFILYIHLISIIVVTVCFVCCPVKLPLSRPTSFCLFLSILLPIPVGGGAIE